MMSKEDGFTNCHPTILENVVALEDCTVDLLLLLQLLLLLSSELVALYKNFHPHIMQVDSTVFIYRNTI